MSKRFTRQEKSQPKHSHYSSTKPITRNSVVIPPNPSSRPEWRGTGFQKPKKKAPQKVTLGKEKELEIENCVSEKLQREFLRVVRTAFPVCLKEYEELKPLLTDVKRALDAGGQEFQGNIGREKEMKEVFLVRWGVERSLMLASLLVGWAEDEFKSESLFENLRLSSVPFTTVCFGNGAEELGTLAMLLRMMRDENGEERGEARSQSTSNDSSTAETDAPSAASQLLIHGPPEWIPETSTLHSGLKAPPILSKYASEAAKAAASPFLPPSLPLEAHHIPHTPIEKLEFSSSTTAPCLFLFAYSLAEMRNASLPNTIKILLAITRDAAKGSLLVVVDNVEIPEELKGEKRYPLRFVLDLALLGRGVGKGNGETGEHEGDEGSKAALVSKWERLRSDEERIYKPERCAEYPVSLGKVAVQVHLFRKVG
ncbi:hypothetical protein M011DRAFT_472067 [Sporormia fimetaria CBS 119925]|uniref:Uncharacterized protein n=1 Tax=Sporormia fimetaria CBS 119925 TaxID=1340428 RepID=A0A6A6V086_9PLEO|nr:hypothetical protein M011DRAFT_472067 [Sporormia fimetaria CBS 119925]